MTRTIGRMLPLALLVLAGCGVAPAGAPVPLEGKESELAALAGSWTGRYRNARGGGHGTITFRLDAGADTARGQVEMTFAPALELYGEKAGGRELPRQPCTTIDIAVVRVEEGTIRGTLAPYWNPACDCRTVSVFEGRRTDGRIAGTFVTRREGGEAVLSTGRWQVERAGQVSP
jgi:hypothetical protein